jgi:transcriptional regulator with XRE-family HTH domain
MQDLTLGHRLQSVRKRRGFTQTELARAAGVSASLVRKLEQDVITDVRLETAHKLAVALRVPTTALITGTDREEADHDAVRQWAPVKRALHGLADGGEPAEEPSADGLEEAFNAAVSALLSSRYAEVRAMLPALLRDADTLVAVSVNGTQARARRLRSQVRQMTAYMMAQTRQFGTASEAIGLAIDDASDGLTTMAAIDWEAWTMIRQGRLAEARDLASRWADDSEPRMSRATPDDLSAWGRFLIRASTAAVRDNRPGEAADFLKLARVAATGIGMDVIPRSNPWQVFGPMTVSMFQAQNALIQGRPDVTLGIGRQLEGRAFPLAETWNRHRLDMANAYAVTRQYGEAARVLQQIRQAAPEWLVQQRYARDILGRIIGRRRTLSAEMRELADFLGLPYLTGAR